MRQVKCNTISHRSTTKDGSTIDGEFQVVLNSPGHVLWYEEWRWLSLFLRTEIFRQNPGAFVFHEACIYVPNYDILHKYKCGLFQFKFTAIGILLDCSMTDSSLQHD